VEFVRFINGGAAQGIAYANDPGVIYPMTLPGDLSSAIQGSVGFTVQAREGVQTGLEYLFTTSGKSGYSNGVRGTLKIPF
jgi:hypothetical protein